MSSINVFPDIAIYCVLKLASFIPTNIILCWLHKSHFANCANNFNLFNHLFSCCAETFFSLRKRFCSWAWSKSRFLHLYSCTSHSLRLIVVKRISPPLPKKKNTKKLTAFQRSLVLHMSGLRPSILSIWWNQKVVTGFSC